MAERFQRLYNLEPNIYSVGCPLLIEAGVLHKDLENGKIFVQLKIRNIGGKIIEACKASIKAFENNGSEIEGVEKFSYLDLKAEAGQEFGAKVPIYLPNITARKFAVVIEEIVFEDGTVLQTAFSEWSKVETQGNLIDVLGEQELVNQYGIDAACEPLFMPEVKKGLFYCVCGSVNQDSVDKCYKCGHSYKELSVKLNKELLSKNKAERLKKEQERRTEEEAKQKEKKKGTQRIIRRIVFSLVAIAIVIAAGFIIKFIIGVERTKEKYNDACEAYTTGAYVEAIKEFGEIEEYKDAKHMRGCAYAKYVVQLLEQKYYGDAASAIVSLKRYDDKEGELIELANDAYEKAYSEAVILCNSGDYYSAKAIFAVTPGDTYKYQQYCELAIELTQSLEKKNLTELYQRITSLNGFNEADKLIDSNPTLSKIKSWEGTWKATNSKGWGYYAEHGALLIEIKNASLIIITKKYKPDDKWDDGGYDREYDNDLFLLEGKIVSGYSYMINEGEYDDLDEVVVNGNSLRLRSSSGGYIDCQR